jgi:hypothetical protein
MVRVNLKKNRNSKQVLVEQDTYEARIINITDIFVSPGYNGKEMEKLIINFNLYYRKENPISLPMFVSAIVSKGNGDYHNSKLYDILEKATEIDRFKSFGDELEQVTDEQKMNSMFVTYLKKNLIGKTCKILVKTVTSKSGDAYSVVDKVIKFYPAMTSNVMHIDNNTEKDKNPSLSSSTF